MKEYHRKSVRLPEYDYSQPGAYFVTLVTKNRELLFGKIESGEIIINQFGLIVASYWQKLSSYFPIQIDKFVVMPNHFHGIILIMNCKGEASGVKVDLITNASSPDASPLPNSNRPNGTIRGSLSAIVQHFKSITTRRINSLQNTRGVMIWQRNYYEHIIRNEDGLRNIREYINNNPLRWEMDELNRKNLTSHYSF